MNIDNYTTGSWQKDTEDAFKNVDNPNPSPGYNPGDIVKREYPGHYKDFAMESQRPELSSYIELLRENITQYLKTPDDSPDTAYKLESLLENFIQVVKSESLSSRLSLLQSELIDYGKKHGATGIKKADLKVFLQTLSTSLFDTHDENSIEDIKAMLAILAVKNK